MRRFDFVVLLLSLATPLSSLGAPREYGNSVEQQEFKAPDGSHFILFIYNRRWLGEVIRDMQRYSHRQLVLDPSLDYLPYSCSFRSDSIDAWFQSLEHSKEVPFEITEEPDRIVIRAKPEEVKAWVRAWCKTGAYECNRE